METEKSIKQWIEDWVNLWPEDVRWNNVKIKSPVKDCVNKMIKFCKDNPQYKKSTIFAATEKYLSDQEQKGWEYTKRSVYFINKLGQPSMLADYCEMLIDNTSSTQQPDINIDFFNDFI